MASAAFSATGSVTFVAGAALCSFAALQDEREPSAGRSALAAAPCECEPSAEIVAVRQLLRLGDSRSGAVRMRLEHGKPSAEIVRVEALSLRRSAHVS